MFCREHAHARPDQGLDRFFDDQADQIVGRVVASRPFPCEDIGTNSNPIAIADDLVFEQTLVDRAELLDAKVAIVDVVATIVGLLE